MSSVSEVVTVFGAVAALSAFVSQLLLSRDQYLNQKAYRRVIGDNSMVYPSLDLPHHRSVPHAKHDRNSHYTTVTTKNINPKQLEIEVVARRRIMVMQDALNHYFSEIYSLEAAILN